MTVLELGVFAGSPAAHARTRATLLPRLERLRAIWPQLTVRTRHYVAPADVLVFVVVAAESRPVPGRSQVVAGAAAPDPELAATIFCAELAERAASAWYGGGVGRRRGTADELVAEGGSVFDCAGYVGTPLASGPLGFATFDLRRTYEWVPAECLTTGSPVWIPLPLVAPSVPPAERFCEQTTIGCAAAGDVDLATARGLEELHERHILRVAWFLGRPFEPAPAPPAWAALAEADARAGWTTRFYRAAIAPGLELAVLYGRHRAEPLYTIGSGCGRSWAEAAEHATRETVQGRLVAWLYRHGTPAPRAVRSYPDHLFWYSRPERIGCVDRFFDRLGAPGHAASPAADWFDDAELRGGAVRLRLLEETDINVVRVLSPALQPLEARHDGARLVGPWRRRHTAGSLRTVPHPFG